jgi:hypothetical protein
VCGGRSRVLVTSDQKVETDLFTGCTYTVYTCYFPICLCDGKYSNIFEAKFYSKLLCTHANLLPIVRRYNATIHTYLCLYSKRVCSWWPRLCPRWATFFDKCSFTIRLRRNGNTESFGINLTFHATRALIFIRIRNVTVVIARYRKDRVPPVACGSLQVILTAIELGRWKRTSLAMVFIAPCALNRWHYKVYNINYRFDIKKTIRVSSKKMHVVAFVIGRSVVVCCRGSTLYSYYADNNKKAPAILPNPRRVHAKRHTFDYTCTFVCTCKYIYT